MRTGIEKSYIGFDINSDNRLMLTEQHKSNSDKLTGAPHDVDTVKNSYFSWDIEYGFQSATEAPDGYKTKPFISVICKPAGGENSCIVEEHSLFTNLDYSTSAFTIELTDDVRCESVYNAMSRLSKLINNNSGKNGAEDQIPLSRLALGGTVSPSTSKSNVISMIKKPGGTYEVPVELNGVLKISFIFDSGASDVTISADVASTLIRTGTINPRDYLGTQKYQFANGDTATSKVFMLHQIKIGNKILTNVSASISEALNAPMLLGQNVLQRFGKITIDNKNHTLTVE